MPGTDGATAIARITAPSPPPRVLVLTTPGSPSHFHRSRVGRSADTGCRSSGRRGGGNDGGSMAA
jgi:hypothetical protein